jgi:bacterioferritin
MMKKGDRQKIIKALNTDLGLEIAAIIQYMHHHVTAEGMESPAIIDLFEKVAKAEMKHMEMLAKRINYLGGVPTTKPAPIKTGGTLKKMIKDDLNGEYMAIKTYKAHIELCSKLGDSTSRLMLEQIVTDEEDHADTWETILAKRPK